MLGEYSIAKCLTLSLCSPQLGVKALTVEDLLQAQKEISAHNHQLKEQTKQLERDMIELRDHSLLLVRQPRYSWVPSLWPFSRWG